jgi:hypothetical protein
MDTMLETLKTVGSLAGFCTAAFLVWDRYIKHFPVAIIVARPLIPGGANLQHFLCLKNVSDRPILVIWNNSDGSSTQLRLGTAQTKEGILGALAEHETRIALGPDEKVFLPILKPSSFPRIDPDNMLEIDLRWRFAQPRVWRTDRPIRVSIRKRDWEYMIDHFIEPAKDPD